MRGRDLGSQGDTWAPDAVQGDRGRAARGCG